MNCNYCKKEIKNDIAHISEDGIYHLSCYREHLHGPDEEKHKMFECPKCHTLGRVWNRRLDSWRVCKLCKGTGYILENDCCLV